MNRYIPLFGILCLVLGGCASSQVKTGEAANAQAVSPQSGSISSPSSETPNSVVHDEAAKVDSKPDENKMMEVKF